MIDINKQYKTRDGQDARITGIHPNGWPVVCYIGPMEEGNCYIFWNNEDLIKVIETEAKDTSAMKIDINKEYKTRDGQDARIVRIYTGSSALSDWPKVVEGFIGEEEEEYGRLWTSEGKYYSERESDLDLVEVIDYSQITKSSNPKDIIGLTKPSLSAVPMRSVYEMSKAMNDGASKYGRFNWRENSVDSDVYIDATLRHLNSWQDGENVCTMSRVHHLAHAMACLSIIIDAELGGNLIDSRSKISTGGVADYLAANTKENK